MHLVWYRRKDGLWNAACACDATICGVELDRRADAEQAHFDRTRMERDCPNAVRHGPSRGTHLVEIEHPERFATDQIPACGPKLPEANPNLPDPFVFA